MGIIYFIILLSLIVFIHELGHLIAAKLFNVYCFEFSIGMGPKIISKKIKETVYSIRLLPIGGFVAMAGEDNYDETIDVPYERTIKGIKRWKQIIVMLAGVFMNFMLAWFVISGLILSNGEYYKPPLPIIEKVVENSPAYTAGFKENDYIKKVTLSDNTVITPKSFYDILPFTQMEKSEITYTVLRENTLIDIKVTPVYDENTKAYLIGIQIPQRTKVDINIFNFLYYGAINCIDILKTMFISIIRLFKGVGLNQLSGPVGIYKETAKQASLGISNYLMLIAVFSLNIGILNLFPIPALDGGRVLITITEMILNKPINKKLEYIVMGISWVLMLSLMIFATWQDIYRIFKG